MHQTKNLRADGDCLSAQPNASSGRLTSHAEAPRRSAAERDQKLASYRLRKELRIGRYEERSYSEVVTQTNYREEDNDDHNEKRTNDSHRIADRGRV